MITVKRVLASELKEDQGIKAPGAPAFSTIRAIEDMVETTECIRVQLDWGAMHYTPDKQVWVLA